MKPTLMDFDFAGAPVRVVMKADAPWFVAADVAAVLGYRNAPDAVRMLPKEQKGTHILRTLGGPQRQAIITEAGLYRLILRSRRTEAERFTDWVTGEVLPQIRKTGEFRAAWSKTRFQAAASYRVMAEVLRMTRLDTGKSTATQQYSNEARLINYVLNGQFAALQRDGLSEDDLALLVHLEERNAVLIVRGVDYVQRKPMLKQYAIDWILAHSKVCPIPAFFPPPPFEGPIETLRAKPRARKANKQPEAA